MVDLNTVGVRTFTGDVSRRRLWRTLALTIAAMVIALALAARIDGLAGTLFIAAALFACGTIGLGVLLGRQETLDHRAYEAGQPEPLFPEEEVEGLSREAVVEGFVETLIRVQMNRGPGQRGAMENFNRYDEECVRRGIDREPLIREARDRLGPNWTQFEWLPDVPPAPEQSRITDDGG